MAWTISYGEGAKKDLEKIDRQIARRIRDFMVERIAPLENPRAIGEALKGSKLGDFWRYRVGDYRLLCSLEDAVCRVLVVRVGHRRQVYR